LGPQTILIIGVLQFVEEMMAAPVKSNGWLAGMMSCVVLMLNGAFPLTTLLPTNLVKWDLCFPTFSRLFSLPAIMISS